MKENAIELKELATSIANIEFPNPTAQRMIAKAIYDQRFGTEATTLKILVASIVKFTDPDAQHVVALAIRDQRFGTEATTLTALATSIATIKFITLGTQECIAMAIYDQRFGTEATTLTALATSLANMQFTDKDAQRSIARAIYKERFGAEFATLKILATSLANMQFTDKDAQMSIARAISQKKFGRNTATLTALATSLATIKFTDAEAQQTIAGEIHTQGFGTADVTLTALATSLATMQFTDAEAQQWIAKAISQKKFEKAEATLTALATSLATMQFTDAEAQRFIAQAIYDQKFGADTITLTALATSLATMQFTDPKAQKWIAEAIIGQIFGTAEATLTALATSLATMQFTDPEAQQWIAKAIYNQQFDTADATLKALATSLSTMQFNDRWAQHAIALAVRDKKFGTVDATLEILAKSFVAIQFTYSVAQELIAMAISEQKFGTVDATLTALATSIATMQFTDSLAITTIAKAIAETGLDIKFRDMLKKDMLILKSYSELKYILDIYGNTQEVRDAIYEAMGKNPLSKLLQIRDMVIVNGVIKNDIKLTQDQKTMITEYFTPNNIRSLSANNMPSAYYQEIMAYLTVIQKQLPELTAIISPLITTLRAGYVLGLYEIFGGSAVVMSGAGDTAQISLDLEKLKQLKLMIFSNLQQYYNAHNNTKMLNVTNQIAGKTNELYKEKSMADWGNYTDIDGNINTNLWTGNNDNKYGMGIRITDDKDINKICCQAHGIPIDSTAVELSKKILTLLISRQYDAQSNLQYISINTLANYIDLSTLDAIISYLKVNHILNVLPNTVINVTLEYKEGVQNPDNPIYDKITITQSQCTKVVENDGQVIKVGNEILPLSNKLLQHINRIPFDIKLEWDTFHNSIISKVGREAKEQDKIRSMLSIFTDKDANGMDFAEQLDAIELENDYDTKITPLNQLAENFVTKISTLLLNTEHANRQTIFNNAIAVLVKFCAADYLGARYSETGVAPILSFIKEKLIYSGCANIKTAVDGFSSINNDYAKSWGKNQDGNAIPYGGCHDIAANSLAELAKDGIWS